MPVSFSQIPPNTLLPLFYAEVTQAREPISSNLKLCLIGQANKDGAYGEGYAVANIPYILTGPDANALFGRGSMLSWMYQKARRQAPYAEIWGVMVPEHVDSFRSIGRLTVIRPGSATLKGTAKIYIAGRPVVWAVRVGDATNVIAARIASAVNARDLPVKATVAGSVVTLTCRWAGNTGNQINITWVGPRGRADANAPDTVLGRNMVTVNGMSGGSGENDPRSCFANLVDRPFDLFCSAIAGGSYYNAVADFMEERWGPYQQLYGHMVTVMEASFQTLYDYNVGIRTTRTPACSASSRASCRNGNGRVRWPGSWSRTGRRLPS